MPFSFFYLNFANSKFNYFNLYFLYYEALYHNHIINAICGPNVSVHV